MNVMTGMTRNQKWGWLSGIITGSIVLDQWTKLLAIQNLKGKPTEIYLGDLFRLQYSENPGAFLSLGSALPDGLRFWLLTVLVGTFLGFMLGFLIREIYRDGPDSIRMTRLQLISLSLITGGGLSNLLDRALRSNGQVVDFMNTGIGSLRTGIFNVADMGIMLGTGLFLLHSFKENGKENGKENDRESHK